MDKGLGSQISAATAFGKGLDHGCPEAASKKSHSLNLPDAWSYSILEKVVKHFIL